MQTKEKEKYILSTKKYVARIIPTDNMEFEMKTLTKEKDVCNGK